jgi:hypothetical protein
VIELSSDLALMPPASDYQPRTWPSTPTTLSQWGGGPPPLKFVLTGFPIASPEDGKPAYASVSGRSVATATR